MCLTSVQKPVVWLPWIPFQVFWALLSAGALHYGLMASGSVCVCAEAYVCVCLCTQHIDAVCEQNIRKTFCSLYIYFFYLSQSPSLYLTSSLPYSPQIDSLSVAGQSWPVHFGPAEAHLSGSALCIQAERLMGPGDRVRQRWSGRIREKDRGKEGVMVKGNLAVKVLS